MVILMYYNGKFLVFIWFYQESYEGNTPTYSPGSSGERDSNI